MADYFVVVSSEIGGVWREAGESISMPEEAARYLLQNGQLSTENPAPIPAVEPVNEATEEGVVTGEPEAKQKGKASK